MTNRTAFDPSDEIRRLVDFARPSVVDGGAAWLDARGKPDLRRPLELWITTRMLHVFSLAALWGDRTARDSSETLVQALLRGPLADDGHGGWFESTASRRKSAYGHSFVLLAASSARMADVPGAATLLPQAAEVFAHRFWDDEAGACVDTYLQPDFTNLDTYRGLNGNMHAVEAMHAATDATGDRSWDARARRVCVRVVDLARDHGNRLPEHFDEDWNPELSYNSERPDDPFKPFGATVGHGLEWSRLLLQAARRDVGGDQLFDERSAAEALTSTAVDLFDRAVADGWAADGRPGFIYTTDWVGRPVVRDRMHWVVAEAIAAGRALSGQKCGDSLDVPVSRRVAEWVEFAASHHRDEVSGSWHHQLDRENRPTHTVWPGKPDVYHAVQACLFLLGADVGPSLAGQAVHLLGS